VRRRSILERSVQSKPDSREQGRRSTRSRRPRETAEAEDAIGPVRLRDLVAEPDIPEVRGSSTVSARLPNGRTTSLELDPNPVAGAEIEQLRRAIQRRSILRAEAQQLNAVAVRELAERTAADTKRLIRRHVRTDQRLEVQARIGDRVNERRFEREAARVRRENREQERETHKALRRLQRRQLWDAILVASSAPAFAAYGQRSNPFTETNVTLLLSSLVWLLGDELSDMLAETPRPAGEIVRERDLWSYIAPLGNVLTAWWLFDDRQHERFVSGISDRFTEQRIPRRDRPERRTLETTVDLAQFVRPDHIDDLRTFTEVAVVTTSIGTWQDELRALGADGIGVSATVELGIMTILVSVTSSAQTLPLTPLPQPTIAWLIDVREPKR
jgi:hypothetical protein